MIPWNSPCYIYRQSPPGPEPFYACLIGQSQFKKYPMWSIFAVMNFFTNTSMVVVDTSELII